MIETIAFDKDARRKRIIIRTTVTVIIGYVFTQAATFVARLLGLTSMSYAAIAVLCGVVIGANLLVVVATLPKKKISTAYANAVFFSQFFIWVSMYTLWIYHLNEIRVSGLLFALMALIFLVSNSNFIQSFVISMGAAVSQAGVTYYAIYYGHQSGSFMNEMFYLFCFIPSAMIISISAGQFNRQRNEIKEAKRIAESTRDALWGEMELAKKIQTVLLPVRPEIKGYEISAIMIPAEEVGGDYYDILNVNGKDWLAIGDVSGHGVPAGLLMMMVQTSIKVALEQHPDMNPSALLTVINRVITENVRRLLEDKYMTITVLAVFDNGRFHFSGLHQDIMVYRVRDRQVEIIETRGMWLGLMENIQGEMRDDTLTLDVGDTMLVFTDGITEAWEKDSVIDKRKPETEMFGEERLISLFRSLGGTDPESIKDGILKELEKYRRHDDVTLLIMRRME